MIFSRATSHALRALAALGADGTPRPAQVLAKELGIPGPYMVKVFQVLAQGGILESVRGSKGGFRLARRPEEVTVWEIVKLVESGEPLRTCFLGLVDCGRTKPCPLHDAWAEARGVMEARFGRLPLSELQAAFRE